MAFVTNTLVLFLAATALISVAAGFSIDLLHRDSPDSPLYNPLETRAERLQNAAMRTIGAARHRIDRLRPATSGGIATPLVPDTFTVYGFKESLHILFVYVGTPSFPIVAIIDTGSDVIWTQCKPCRNCFKQIAPMFDPKKSSTYTNLRCSSKMCSTALTDRIFCRNGDVCAYSMNYGDQSYTIGDVAIDTLTLNSTGVLSQLQDAVDSQVRGGTPSQVEGMAPCYNDLGRLIVPNVTMHFQGGDVVLTRMNTFVEAGDNVYCFAFVETDSIAIYGNVAQHNFLVGYDIKERSVTFKPKDCTA
ncbi:Aspartic proteinase CDR1 [Linum grandiflorum]